MTSTDFTGGGSEGWNGDVGAEDMDDCVRHFTQGERPSVDGFCAPCVVAQEADKWQDLRGTATAKAAKGCRACTQEGRLKEAERRRVVSGNERGLVGLR